MKVVPLFLAVALAALEVDVESIDQDVLDNLAQGQQEWREPPKIDVPPPKPTGEIEHAQYEPYPASEGEFADALLFEQFDGSPQEVFKRWKPSHARKAVDPNDKKAKRADDDEEEEQEWAYVGEWAVEEPTVFKGFEGDQGLVLKSPAAHHAITHKFDKVLDNTDKTLVVQYEVKTQQPLLCGGAYMKLLADSDSFRNEEFNNETPYVIMFGPDKCGSTDKVHLIIKRHGGEEHHLALPPRTKSGLLSTLYTLIIHDDQRYEIRIDGLTAKAGLLTEEGAFLPGFNPPKEIDDVNDFKPDDWVEEEQIPDPEQAEKPEDWDESAPMKIPDPDAVAPAGWNEDLEPLISDPDAVKPEEWDDEEDGEWIAPEIPNPACAQLPGCGAWTAPLIRNPEYRGKWRQPLIPNPAYKGPWSPRKVPNPDYFEDERPSDLDPIAGVGFELWTMQPDILFDNIYIGHSVIEAENVGNATWSPKYYIEVQAQSAARGDEAPKDTETPSTNWKKEWELFRAQPREYTSFYYNQFVSDFTFDKVYAVQEHPLATALFALGFVLLTSLLFGVANAILVAVSGRDLPAIEKKKKEARVNPDAVVDPATTTIEKGTAAESEIQRRRAGQ